METRVIDILTANPDDATSYYRAYGAINAVKNASKYNIVLTDDTSVNWRSACKADITMMCIPHNDTHVRIAEIIKNMGGKLWIDYDDLIYDMPAWFKNAHYYQDSKNIGTLLSMADQITFSTSALCDHFSSAFDVRIYGNKIVRENYQCHNMPIINPDDKTMDDKMHIVWRGSYSHNLDVAYTIYYIKQALSNVHNMPNNIVLHLIGEPSPAFFSADLPCQIMRVPPLEIDAYFDYIHKLPFAVGIVPLIDNNWNMCKSDIAYQEYLEAGMLSLQPFHADCIGYYDISDPATITSALTDLLNLYNSFYGYTKEWTKQYNYYEIVQMKRRAKMISIINNICNIRK